MLTLIEKQCALWFAHSMLIWKVGRHLLLQDVVRIRDSGYKHLTHSHYLRLLLITCFSYHSIYHIA